MLDVLLGALAFLCLSVSALFIAKTRTEWRGVGEAEEAARTRRLEEQYASGRGPMASLMDEVYGQHLLAANGGNDGLPPDETADGTAEDGLVDEHLRSHFGQP